MLMYLPGTNDELRAQARRIAESAASTLQAAGLATTPVMQEGDAAAAIVTAADRAGVDCVFVGARGHGAMDRSSSAPWPARSPPTPVAQLKSYVQRKLVGGWDNTGVAEAEVEPIL